MNIEDFRIYCLQKKGVSESFPFNDSALVFKVINKMFALTSLNSEFTITLKCDPIKALELRDAFEAVTAAYHFNKKHWISLHIDGTLPDELICQLIDLSYELVLSKLTKKQKNELDSTELY